MTLTIVNHTKGFRFEHKNLSQQEVNRTITLISENRLMHYHIIATVTE